MSHCVVKQYGSMSVYPDQYLGQGWEIAAIAIPTAIRFISGMVEKRNQLQAIKSAETNAAKIKEINSKIEELNSKITHYQDEIEKEELYQTLGRGGLIGGVVLTSAILAVILLRKAKQRGKK